jgi:RHS repeat-associated protein
MRPCRAGLHYLFFCTSVVGFLLSGVFASAAAGWRAPAAPLGARATVATRSTRGRRMACTGYSESISPCTASKTAPPSSAISQLYSLQNNSIENEDYYFSWSGAIASSCTFPSHLAVTAHTSGHFTANCTASAGGGAGTLTVTASGNLTTLTATMSVTVNAMSVTPDTSIQVLPGKDTTQLFTVHNLQNVSSTVTLTKSCATFTCTLLRTSPITIGANSTDTVRVEYVTGVAGTSDVVTLTGAISGQSGSTDGGLLSVAVPSPLAPTVSLSPHNGDNRSPGLCIANCFDVSVGYSTPSYLSRDAARSASLVYSSAQAHPMPVIQLDATDVSTYKGQVFSFQLRHGGANKKFLAAGPDSTELYVTQTTGGATTRLAGQFDGTALATGVYFDTVITKTRWTSGPYSGTVTQTNTAIPILVLNESASPFGAGWSLAGLQHLYFTSDSLTLLVTDGAGSITRFTSACTHCDAAAAAADFSVIRTILSGSTVSHFERKSRDGAIASFNTAGFLTSISNRIADSTTFAYDGSNHIQTITDPAGKTLTFAYTSGKLTSITDPNGRVSTFAVNGSGDLASIGDPTGTTTFQGTYDAQHRLTQRTDRASNTWKYVYDFASKLASDSTPSVTVDTTITGAGSLVVSRLGMKVGSLEAAILIDPSSGLGTSSNPASQRVSTTVRAVTYGMPLETTTAHATRFALDRFLAPLQVEQDSLADTTFITRDGNEHVTRTVEHRKLKTVASDTSTFDGPRLTHVTNALTGSSITYAYDTTYDLVKRVLGSTQTVQNYLDATKTRIDSMRVGSNPDSTKDSVSIVLYDTKGRVTTTIDPKKDTVVAYYGSGGFQNTDSTRTGPRITRFRYDSWGRLVRTVNPKGDSVILALDKLNRTDTIYAPGARTIYAYDSLSRIVQLIDPKGQTYAYHYNALGWADVLTDAATGDPAANRKDSLEFTKTGAMRKHVNRRLQPTVTKFDHLGRDSTVTLADGRVTTFAYDSAGLWAAVANGESIDTVRTDTAGLVQTQISNRRSSRYVVTATADSNGLLRSRVFTMGTDPTSLQTISYGYDAEWRLDTLSVGTQRTFFGYNADGLMSFIKLTQHSGTTLDSMTFAVTGVHKQYSVKHSASGLQTFNTGYTRDSLDHITQRTNFHGDTTWNYSYDKLGQLTSYSDLAYSDTVTCVADPRGQDGQVCTSHSVPTTVHSATFTYDSVGNRTDASPTIVAGNRLTNWNGYTLTYDYDGNLTHKSGTGFDQYLYWNSIGQLDSVKTNGSLASFGYDGTGRRVRKTVGSAIYKYVYDGDQILTIDSLGTRVRTYSYYPGIDQPHSVITSAGNRYYYLSEVGAGTVWGLIDTVGGIKNRYQYAPFGTSEVASELVANPFRYTGREYDPETQLYFYRARYYDPSLARFISEDPIGENGGANEYAYASNDPINRSDPSGTDDQKPQMPSCPYAPEADGSCHSGAGGGDMTLGYAGPSIGWTPENSAFLDALAVAAQGPKKECSASLGIAVTVGAPDGNGAESKFLTGSLSAGVTSSGTFFVQYSDAIETGIGAIASIGGQLAFGRGDPISEGTTRGAQADIAGAAGPGVGLSLNFDDEGHLVGGGSGTGLRPQYGGGIQASGGPSTTTTPWVSGVIAGLAKWLSHLCW